MGRCLPVKGSGKIVITGQVLGDGRGDWVAMTNQHKTLKKFFPDKEVRIIASSNTKWEGKLDSSKIKSGMLDLVYYGKATLSGIPVPLNKFPETAKIQEKLEEADVIIEAGIALLPKEFKDKKVKVIKIIEHDMRTADDSWDINFDTELKTGFATDRLGVFTCSPKNYTWHDIENEKLKLALFDTTNPSDDTINLYLSNHLCFFNYMSDFKWRIKFAEDMALFPTSIDICFPNIFSEKKYVKDMENGFNDCGLKFIEQHISVEGIAQIKVLWFNGDEKKEQIIRLGEEGRELRLIDPGNLSAKDFKRMIRISGPCVGCTGDNSLAQTISFGKIPYYEPRFEQKSKALINRICHELGYDSDFYKFAASKCSNHVHPDQQVELSDINFYNLEKQALQFGEIVREKSCFKTVLKGVVNERLLRQKDPDFACQEDKICQDYLDSKITIETLKSRLSELLKDKDLIKLS